MEQFIQNFQEYLIIGLILALFFKESLTSYINQILGIKRQHPLDSRMSTLEQYFNHDTTKALGGIEAGQEKIIDKLDKILVDGVRVRKE